MDSVSAAAKAFAALNHAIITVVEARIASISVPSMKLFPSLRRLLIVVVKAAIESTRGIVNAFICMENTPSASSEELRCLSEWVFQTPSMVMSKRGC